ncbi:MAG: thiosulfate sulfurtransferase GlpE [Pseudomonadales bacterium]
MKTFSRIDITQARQLIDDGANIVDIRDEQTFQGGHVEGATNLGNHNISEYVAQTPQDTPLVVFCYHGNSSQSAAQFLVEQGFDQVFSVDGGFEAWANSPQI